MIDIKTKTKEYLVQALDQLGYQYDPFNIEVTHPRQEEFGDYSTSIIFQLVKDQKASPQKIGEKVISILNNLISQDKEPFIERVELAGNGFVNFWLVNDWFLKVLQEILSEKDKFGCNELLKNKKVMCEYTDPNPFKQFHIGHLMSNSIGESLSRLIEFSGAEVKRANYQGDVGVHVAKAVYGIHKRMTNNKIQMSNLEEKPLEERIKFLGESYALGASKYKEDEKTKGEIDEINQKIFE